LLLADEINRAPAKVQSALLEVMQERQVTIGHDTMPVPDPFLVMATQNPIESEGTYPLPEAQVDRFMLKVVVGYPSRDEELTVVHRSLEPAPAIRQILAVERLRELQRAALDVYVDPSLVAYTVSLAEATRDPAAYGVPGVADLVAYGASPRGPISLVQSARALALVHGREYVLGSDVRGLAKDALRHRLVLTYRALAEGRTADDVLDAVLEKVPAPPLELGRPIAA
jgi:MoxR-like ATPase